MMRTATTILAVAFWCCLVAALARTPVDNLQSSAHTVEGPPNSCPITKPPKPPFVPPAPYPSDAGEHVWIGSPKLWTDIPRDGTWRGLPHYTPDDTRYRNKVFWWSEGYDWRTEGLPRLTISGKRLDGPAPPLSTDPPANAGWTNAKDQAFMVHGIFIPNPRLLENHWT